MGKADGRKSGTSIAAAVATDSYVREIDRKL